MSTKITNAMRKVRREMLDAVIARVEAGEPLPMAERIFAVRILEKLKEGYDPREDVGAKPKTGAPPTTRGPQKWMAIHYLKLCAEHSGTLAKTHAGTVADRWNTTSKVVMNAASKHRNSVAQVLELVTLEQIESTVKEIVKKPAPHRNHG